MTRTLWMFFVVSACCLPAGLAAQSQEKPFDPLAYLSRSFPDTVELKNNGRLLEFCPDGTCDGFVTSGDVSITSLKDFAYLYVYFFSDYTFLDEWRNKQEAKSAAERVLSKPGYRNCGKEDSREAARCVLRNLSRAGRIRLIFVRYDEGERHVIPKNIAEALSERRLAPKQ